MEDKLLRSLKNFVTTNGLDYTETPTHIVINKTVKETLMPENEGALIKEVIDYLNKKAGKKFRHNTQANAKVVSARLKEFSVGDIKTVIDTKVKEWSGTKFDKYLQPSTLFRASNFENYINQTEPTNPLTGFFGGDW